MTASVWRFCYLQALDLLTTVAFLLHGVREGNPFVRFAISAAPSPLLGLVAVKLVAIGLAFWCLRMGRDRLLGRMNLMFAMVVAWNLLALIAAGVHGAEGVH
jgi:hypothetical protein